MIVTKQEVRSIDPKIQRIRQAWHDSGIRPLPIAAAPESDDEPLLLFCPDQGGWHTGVCFLGRWLAYYDTSVVLHPSHWLPVPGDPPIAK
jgi:hypothetical protein